MFLRASSPIICLQTKHIEYHKKWDLLLVLTRRLKQFSYPFFANRVMLVAVSSACGTHSCPSTATSIIGGWPSGSTVCFTPMLIPEVLNGKQGNSMYHIFSSLWYESTGCRALD